MGACRFPVPFEKQFVIKAWNLEFLAFFLFRSFCLGPHVKVFPLEDWHSFLERPMVRKLADNVPGLTSIRTWPSAVEWQGLGELHSGYKDLNLCFALEQKPGQRARRKIPKNSLRTYEQWIFESQEIPTRADNWHDFFNALIWINFPLAKKALHHKALLIQQSWPSSPDFQKGKRSRLADRLTCFDEGGVVYEMSKCENRLEVERILHSHDEELKEEFVRRNTDRFTLFGHGILEVLIKKLSKGEKETDAEARLNASCIILNEGSESRDLKLKNYLESFDENSRGHGTITVAWI